MAIDFDSREMMLEKVKESGGFVQEPNEYNKYMSHPLSDKFPMPVWKVSQETLVSLNKHFVVGQEKDPKDAKVLLEKSLDDNLDSIAKHDGYTFKIPKSKLENMEFNETLKISLLCAGKDINRTYHNLTTRHTAAKTAWVTERLRDNIQQGIPCTKRDLYYEKKELFSKKQRESDLTLTDLCASHRCRLSSFMVLSSVKGTVLGDIVLKLESGLELNCSEGIQIPNVVKKIQEIKVLDSTSHIEYILVVEKYTMQFYLEQMNFHKKHHCIIMTGSGMPGRTTREFLKLLKDKTKLPVYGLCDPNPSGALILSVYARGSAESAYDNFNLAVPSLRWVGVTTIDLENFEKKLPETSYEEFSSQDKSKLDLLLNVDYMKLSEGWLEKVKHMKKFGKKTEFEELKQFGISYFADEELPKLISRANTST